MSLEEKVYELESKIQEQEILISELFQAAVNAQTMLKERIEQHITLQKDLNSLSEAVILISKRI